MRDPDWRDTISVENYIKSLPPAENHHELLTEMRQTGTKLAEAASRVLRTWDGHHRLSLAVAEWFTLLANERRIITKRNTQSYGKEK
jgi:hypothetical protein